MNKGPGIDPGREVPMTDNILAVFHQAAPSDLWAVNWYRIAHKEIEDLAGDLGLPVWQVAGIVAALSPRTRWDANLDDARRLVTGGRPWALKANQAKARRILAGEDPDKVLSGPKVRSFYQNLTDPEDPQAVTVDIWAYRVWSGNWGEIKWVHEPLYGRVAEAYRQAAAEVGLLPSELQAIAWVTIRRLARYGIDQPGII
jgi:hypothetical protein